MNGLFVSFEYNLHLNSFIRRVAVKCGAVRRWDIEMKYTDDVYTL